jgi:hypothetical protein
MSRGFWAPWRVERCAFPQVGVVVHAKCGSKALLDAVFDGYRTAETILPQNGHDQCT